MLIFISLRLNTKHLSFSNSLYKILYKIVFKNVPYIFGLIWYAFQNIKTIFSGGLNLSQKLRLIPTLTRKLLFGVCSIHTQIEQFLCYPLNSFSYKYVWIYFWRINCQYHKISQFCLFYCFLLAILIAIVIVLKYLFASFFPS